MTNKGLKFSGTNGKKTSHTHARENTNATKKKRIKDSTNLYKVQGQKLSTE